MNNDMTMTEGLRAYLTGVGRRNREVLACIANYEHWPNRVLQEIERRAAATLAELLDIEVAAIARGEVNLRELAQQVLTEIGKE